MIERWRLAGRAQSPPGPPVVTGSGDMADDVKPDPGVIPAPNLPQHIHRPPGKRPVVVGAGERGCVETVDHLNPVKLVAGDCPDEGAVPRRLIERNDPQHPAGGVVESAVQRRHLGGTVRLSSDGRDRG